MIYTYYKSAKKKTVLHDAKIARQAGYIATISKNEKGQWVMYSYRRQDK